jgi:hypothetical protein
MKIYISKMKKTSIKKAKQFQNPTEKGKIDIPVNIYMTSHFPGLV